MLKVKSIDEATGGVIRVKKNGSLTINTGTGGSTAMKPDNLTYKMAQM
ncbi:hypothetical protein [Lactobacillus helveticus]